MFGHSRPPPQAGGTPSFNPAPRMASPARDIAGYCLAVPATAMTAPLVYFLTQPLVEGILAAFLPFGFAMIGSMIWMIFALAALLFFYKSLVSNFAEAVGIRFKLAVLNAFRR